MSMDDTAHDAVYDDDEATESVAIIGMALRVPGAQDVEGYWDNLRRGVESVRFLSDDELRAEGESEREMAGSHYVPAAAVLDGHDRFDAPFFDFSLREGSILDPQDRHFLECSYEALERAGYDPARTDSSIGVFGGEGMNGYLFFNLQSNPQIVDTFGWLQLRFSNDKDFLTTLVSYKLDLKGPSVNVQTACSTSLVAVHLARESLLAGQCDIALAGGVTINVPQNVGYRWEDGSIASPDGHCRVFDARGAGTVPASGVGVVVLKRLDEALEDGDHIHGVLRGSALNNDGNLKVGYTAPSVEGQAEVIATALGIADLDARGIGYVEAHGTATKMGDPIEIAALTRAYREHTADTSFCAIGSVKSNFGHLDAAAGVAGLIKATLAVERGEIPPSLHFDTPNPEIDFAASPFYVADRLIPWPGAADGAEPRRAGVSSFGIGGTNAHAVVEEPPAPVAGSAGKSRQLILLSAKSRSALDNATRRLADHLDEHPDVELADVAYTLATGRRQMLHRRALVADHLDGDLGDAVAGLRDDQRLPTAMAADTPPPVVFLFPGQGAQFPGMTRRLIDEEPVFRDALDRCADGLRAHGIDLRALLFPADPTSDEAAARLRSTANTQPVLFAVEWAMAELWKSWGVVPQALLGHSIGELVAATLAGSLSLDDALTLVATRGRLMQAMEPGAMLAVPRDEATVRGWLADAPEVELAVINAPDLCVVGGPAAAIDAFARRLDAEGVDGRRLHVSHAFHTAMMEPALDELRQVSARLRLAEPEIPWVSNVTGTWITREQATDPGYWAEHVRSTVRFADGVATLLDDPDRVFLEVGPGHVLSDQVRRQRPTGGSRPVPVTLPSAPGPRDEDGDLDVLYAAVGRLWQAGVEVDFDAFYDDQQRCRVPLPTYPFEHRRLWIDPLPTDTRPVEAAAVGSWLSTPLWEQSRPARTAPTASPGRWLLLVDEGGLGDALAGALRATGATVATARLADDLGDEGFAQHDTLRFAVDPLHPVGWRALGAALAAEDERGWRVVHLWSLDLEVEPTSWAPAVELAHASIIEWLGTMGATGGAPPTDLTVVTDGARSVAGVDPPHTTGAVFFAACRTLTEPRILCRGIDLRRPQDGDWSRPEVLDRLVAELTSESRERVVAYRHGRRWRRTFEPLALEGFQERRRLRPQGVYAVLDGLSTAGLSIASDLARRVDARLLLIDHRTVDALDAEDAHRFEMLDELSEVIVHPIGDGVDVAPLRAALDAADERWGSIDGILALSADRRSLDDERARADALSQAIDGWLDASGSALDFYLFVAAAQTGEADPDGLAATTRALFADTWACADLVHTVRCVTIGFDGRVEPSVDARELTEVVRHVLAIDDIDRFAVDLAGLRASMTTPEVSDEEIPDARSHLLTPYVAPRNDVERTLCGLWSDLLGVDPIGIEDGFFDLGGHSLLATQLAARIGERFGLHLPTAELVTSPTVADLARTLDRLRSEDADDDGAAVTESSHELPLIEPDLDGRHEPFGLTDVQQAYWIGRSGAVDFGNVATHAYMELDAPRLDVARLQNAWRRVIARHDMLRAIVEEDGRQRILRAEELPEFELVLHDLRELDEASADARLLATRDELSHKNPPADQWPLFDVEVSLRPDGSARVHLGIDLLISDGWSFSVLSRELTTFYRDGDAVLEPLSLGFRDYVLAEEALASSPLYERALAYWRDRLPTLPPAPELPVVPATGTSTFTRREMVLEKDAWSRLKARAGRAGVSHPGVLLAAFSQVLAFWSKGQHMTLNLTLFNRLPMHPEVNDLIGDFTSLTLLEIDLREAHAFEKRAVLLQEQLWRDLDHRYVSGVRVMREMVRAAGGVGGVQMPVVFTSMLGFDTAGGEGQTPFGVPGKVSFTITQTPQVWLDHQVTETSDGDLAMVWDTVDAIFPDGLLDDMFDGYRRLLHQLADEESAWRRTSFDLLPPKRTREVERINATDAPVPGGLLHEPILARAAERPMATAVLDADGALSYGQLATLGHALAVELRGHQVAPGNLVAVVLPKGRYHAVATLGVLEAGGAYLPIDPGQPQERIWYLLDEGLVDVVVTDAANDRGLAWPTTVARIVVDRLLDELPPADAPAPTPLEPIQRPDDLAYVIFTSGSTGRPKGVMIDHRGALNTCVDVNSRFDIGPDDVVFAISALNFDLSVWDLFGVLGAGGTVVMPEPSTLREPEHWLRLVEEHGVTTWNSVPALVQMLVDYAEDTGAALPTSLRLVLMSGDWIPIDLPDRLRRLLPEIEIISMGGATEASIWSILYPVGEVDPAWKSIPYGRPMVNQRFYVLGQSETLDPKPEHVVGDLYIGGIGLAKGYWRDQEKTRAAFFHHPSTGERLYRTGDLGRWLPSGEIEFLGREDTQVKVQGHRIELGEIEAALAQIPGVLRGVVVAVGERRGAKRLVGYVVLDDAVELPGDGPAPERLRVALAESLPSYMLPTLFVFLDALPLSANGKVDRKALPAPEQAEGAAAERREPTTPLEQTLADAWAEVLGEAPGIDDNFFELGGDSVLATRALTRLRGLFPVEIGLRDLFEAPTVAALAEVIDTRMVEMLEAMSDDEAESLIGS